MSAARTNVLAFPSWQRGCGTPRGPFDKRELRREAETLWAIDANPLAGAVLFLLDEGESKLETAVDEAEAANSRAEEAEEELDKIEDELVKAKGALRALISLADNVLK